MEEPGSQMSITFQAAKVLSPALITTNRSLRYPLTGWGVQIKTYAEYDKSRQSIVCKNPLVVLKVLNLQTYKLACWFHAFHIIEVICHWHLEKFGSMMLRWCRWQWFQQAHTYVRPGSRQKHTRSNGMARPKWFTDVATLHSLNKFLGTFHNWYIDLVIGNCVLLCVWHLL